VPSRNFQVWVVEQFSPRTSCWISSCGYSTASQIFIFRFPSIFPRFSSIFFSTLEYERSCGVLRHYCDVIMLSNLPSRIYTDKSFFNISRFLEYWSADGSPSILFLPCNLFRNSFSILCIFFFKTHQNTPPLYRTPLSLGYISELLRRLPQNKFMNPLNSSPEYRMLTLATGKRSLGSIKAGLFAMGRASLVCTQFPLILYNRVLPFTF